MIIGHSVLRCCVTGVSAGFVTSTYLCGHNLKNTDWTRCSRRQQTSAVREVDKVRQSTSCASPPVTSKLNSDTFSTLHSVTVEETAWLLIRSPAKHCPLDPVPTWLLKRATEQFAPILAGLRNVSFQTRNLPLSQKHVLVSARLKKSTLDPADLSFYRRISQLPFASKLVERAVASRFVHHCDEHGLLLARQSAYRRYHSTETAVVIVYNDIVRPIDPLVLLDLSSAFDSVDHDCLTSILKDRFSVAGVAVSWLVPVVSIRSDADFCLETIAAALLQFAVVYTAGIGT